MVSLRGLCPIQSLPGPRAACAALSSKAWGAGGGKRNMALGLLMRLSWKFHGLSSEPRLITGGSHLCWGNKHIPQIWWAKLSPIGVSHLHVEVPIAAGRTRDPTFAWSNRVTVWFKGLGKTQKWVVYHGLSSFNVQPESWLRIWKLEAQGPSNFCF